MSTLLRALWRSGTGRLGSCLLAALAAGAVAAPLLAPRGAQAQPDILGAQSRPPLSRLHVVELADDTVRLAESVVWQEDELVVQRQQREERYPRADVLNPSEQGVTRRVLFLLGTDRLGRDVWARTLYGTRTSLLVGLLASLLGLGLGLLVGGIAAMSHPAVDTVLMRFVDGMLAIPTLILVIVLAAFLRPSPGLLIVIIGGTAWMGASRLARAEILGLRQREFILAAEAIGQGAPKIFFLHLLPNALAPLLVDTSLRVAGAILSETALSFLGLGIPPHVPSWGDMIAHGRSDLTTIWWASTFPGLAIVVTVLTFNLLADGLRDALDPRLPLLPRG